MLSLVRYRSTNTMFDQESGVIYFISAAFMSLFSNGHRLLVIVAMKPLQNASALMEEGSALSLQQVPFNVKHRNSIRLLPNETGRSVGSFGCNRAFVH